MLCSFGRSRSQVDEEFYIKLIKQAFLIDQAYEGIPSGKDSARFDSFCRNIYRYQSSIENAMHLDCKLFTVAFTRRMRQERRICLRSECLTEGRIPLFTENCFSGTPQMDGQHGGQRLGCLRPFWFGEDQVWPPDRV